MAEQKAYLQQLDLPALQDFVLKRFQADGGFAATPMLAHTISDTYCGIELLFLLRQYLGDDAYRRVTSHGPTRAYLAGFAARQDAISARIKYQLTALMDRVALQADHLPPVGLTTRVFQSFEELYYLTVLNEMKNIARPESGQADFAALPLKTVRECFFYLRLTQTAPSTGPGELELQELAPWLAASQNLDGGFGFYPGTTSYVENSRFALGALNLLIAPPADAGRAAAFVISCQTGAGGFSRNPSAAPFLEDSLFAIRALVSLEAAENRVH